jgi:hypothetical protein
MTTSQILKETISHGLLSFPLNGLRRPTQVRPQAVRRTPGTANALRRHGAVRGRRNGRVLLARAANRLIDEFFLPLVALRNQGHGYAVSLVKAGATLVGHSAGPVRPPPSEMKASEIDQLGQLLSRLGPQ